MGSPGDNQKASIEWSLKFLELKYEKEYRFHDKRRFRFDFAIVEHKIAIEYEGLFSRKSRHTTVRGFSTDTEKYNLAAIGGWLVLRYTALTYKRVLPDLEKILGERL